MKFALDKPLQIFMPIFKTFIREQHQKISLANPLIYILHQFCFQMEFCICQYNFSFCL